MKLQLKTIGDASPFIDWLKKFSKITSSILIEIDVSQKAFIAKTFTEDKACIRYSKITFEDCNLEIDDSKSDDYSLLSDRIKLGILLVLPKFIKIIGSYSSDFSIIIDYDKLNNEMVCTSISFKSEELKMKMDGFRPSEFKYLPDDVFNNSIHIANNPVEISLTEDAIKNIIKFSDVSAVDERADQLVFFNQKFEDKDYLYIKDDSNSFEYKVGEISTNYNFDLSIFRSKFILVMKDSNEPFKLTIGDSKDRVLLDSETSETKIIISIINS